MICENKQPLSSLVTKVNVMEFSLNCDGNQASAGCILHPKDCFSQGVIEKLISIALS